VEGGERSLPTGSETTQMDLEVSGRIPGTILRLRGGGSKLRKKTKNGMSPLGKQQLARKDEGYATIVIARARNPADSNFERQCLLGRAELVMDYKGAFNRVLVGMKLTWTGPCLRSKSWQKGLPRRKSTYRFPWELGTRSVKS